MPRFTTAPVADVAPKRKKRHPSARSQQQREYREALGGAVSDLSNALVAELDPDEKPLTIRNRIKRAAQQLGYTDIVVRRRGHRIVAYRASQVNDDEPGQQPTPIGDGKRKRRSA